MTQDRFVVRAIEAEEGATPFSHPWNPNSELFGRRLSSLAGLSQVGVSRVRVPRVLHRELSRNPGFFSIGSASFFIGM